VSLRAADTATASTTIIAATTVTAATSNAAACTQQRLSDATGSSSRRLNSFAVFSGGDWVRGSELAWMLGNVAVTMAVSLGLPRITQKVST
jgi:hypothetical protein